MAELSTNIGLRPTQAADADFGGIMQRGLDYQMRRRAEDNAKQESQRKRQKELQDQFNIDSSLFSLDNTEFRSINDAGVEIMSTLRDSYYDLQQELATNPSTEVKKNLAKVNSHVSNIRSIHERFVDMSKKGLKMIEEGKLSKVDEDRWQELVESYEKGLIKVRQNDQYDLEILHYDKQGNLQGVIPTYGDLAEFHLIESVDIDEELDDLVKESVGRDKIATNENGYIITRDVFGENQKKFSEDWIDAYLGTDEATLQKNDVMADFLYKMTKQKKRENFTVDERAKVKNWLMDKVRGRYGSTIGLRKLPSKSSRTSSGSSSSSKIFAATENGSPKLDDQNRFLFSLDKPRSLTSAKSDVRISNIAATSDGKISLIGEDRTKVKGNPKSKEEAIENSGASAMDLFSDQDDNGNVTYYERKPFNVQYSDGANNEKTSRLINSFASQLGFRNEDGLRNELYNSFVSEFGKEQADQYFKGDLKPPSKVSSNTTNANQNPLESTYTASSGSTYQ